MSISTLIGSRLLTGIAAFTLTGSLLGGAAMASQPDSPVRELRHEVRDQSKAQRDEIKQLRAEFAAEYAKERPDTEKLERLQTAIEAKRSEIKAMRFAALMKMHDELDAEQRERIAERMAHEGKHHGKHDGDEVEGKGKGKRAEHAKGKGNEGKRAEHAKGKMAKSDKPKGDKAKGDKAKGDKAKRGEPAPI